MNQKTNELQVQHVGDPALLEKLAIVYHEEVGPIHLRVVLAKLMLGFLPYYAGGRVRALVLRMCGFQIGHGSVVSGMPAVPGAGDIYSRLTIGEMCSINIGCFFDLNDAIHIGNHVGVGHEVMILTTSHAIGPTERRNGPVTTAPVVIGDGAWIGARTIVLPGVTVGKGAVVAAGSVVHRDVSPNTLVAGVPARLVKSYSNDSENEFTTRG